MKKKVTKKPKSTYQPRGFTDSEMAAKQMITDLTKEKVALQEKIKEFKTDQAKLAVAVKYLQAVADMRTLTKGQWVIEADALVAQEGLDIIASMGQPQEQVQQSKEALA